jgi:hypothetical protein
VTHVQEVVYSDCCQIVEVIEEKVRILFGSPGRGWEFFSSLLHPDQL